MLSLLLLLAQDPVTPSGPAPVPASAAPVPSVVTVSTLTVFQGNMSAWNRAGQLEGDVAFTVRNTGEPDRIVSVSTPAGQAGEISLQVSRGGTAVRLEPGDRTLAAANPDGTPGISRVTLALTDLAHHSAAPVRTTITVQFETAGAVTLLATPVSPAPASPRQ